MIRRHTTFRGAPISSLLSLGACSEAPLRPTSMAFSAKLSGASEVPAVTTDANGIVEARLGSGTNMLTWKITYSGLSGPPTGAHVHGPAMAGQNAGVVVPISAPLASPMIGSATLTPAQAADLSAGEWYVNVLKAANPNGEVRGQMGVGP